MNGVLLVDKDPGMTSHDVVAKARRILGTKSIGHAGTLDPLASGLLLLLVGEATKVSDYLLTGDKGYEVSVRLGVRTDSMDITGLVLDDKMTGRRFEDFAREFNEERVKAAALAVTGTVNLAVPMHSAVKVNGKKLYESAHKGQIPDEIPIRAMSFYDVEWLGMKMVTPPIRGAADTENAVQAVDAMDSDKLNVDSGKLNVDTAPSTACLEFTVRLRCSKGSFIRAWANHVGDVLGCGGTVTSLRRIMSAPFEIAQAKRLSEIAELLPSGDAQNTRLPKNPTVEEFAAAGREIARTLGSAWVPLAESLPHLGRVEIAGFDATLLRNGQLSKGLQAELLRKIQLGVQPQPVRVIHREERRLLALLTAEPGEFYKIRRVFQ